VAVDAARDRGTGPAVGGANSAPIGDADAGASVMMRQRAARLVSRYGMRPLIDAVFRWSGVVCLNYHRIGEGGRSPFDRELWSASAEAFDEQVRFLAAHFDVVTPDDLPDVSPTPRDRFVLITFDDGYRDNYELAFPILRRHGVAASFFVTTGYVDRPRLPWWDDIARMVRESPRAGLEAGTWLPGPITFDEPGRDEAVATLLCVYKTLPPDRTGPYVEYLATATGSERHGDRPVGGMWMTWDMLRKMRAAGMVIGGHTVDHPVLATLTEDAQCAEISGCAQRIAEELGEPMRYFSYPVGQPDSFNRHSRKCLQRLGVRFAFSYYGGFRRFEEWDAFDVRRIPVERYMDIDWVSATVTLPALFGTV
jgi:peptidoglycan/xylan/chitin deacetylase (PgdA/CDA1 family)